MQRLSATRSTFAEVPLTQCVEFNIPNGLAVEGLRKVPKNRKLEMQSNV